MLQKSSESLITMIMEVAIKWWIRVKSICHGWEHESTLMFDTEEEALKVTKGYIYLS